MSDLIQRLRYASKDALGSILFREAADEIEQFRAEVKTAFMTGFDVGAQDAVDSGTIICPDYKIEVIEAAWKDYNEK